MKFLSFIPILLMTTVFAMAKSTEVIQYKPVENTVPTKEGDCWTESIATPRKGAWRCRMDNDIFDPCFSTSSKDVVICGADPAKKKIGFAMKLTKPLPQSNLPVQPAQRERTPFQIRLSDGSVCAPFTGTRTMIGEEIMVYGCENAYCPTPDSCQIGILSINRLKPRWIAKVVVYNVLKGGKLNVKTFQQVPVETVWE
jgi:hypothetical protein